MTKTRCSATDVFTCRPLLRTRCSWHVQTSKPPAPPARVSPLPPSTPTSSSSRLTSPHCWSSPCWSASCCCPPTCRHPRRSPHNTLRKPSGILWRRSPGFDWNFSGTANDVMNTCTWGYILDMIACYECCLRGPNNELMDRCFWYTCIDYLRASPINKYCQWCVIFKFTCIIIW